MVRCHAMVVIKIGDARITHEVVWGKSAAHVSRPGKATETHPLERTMGFRLYTCGGLPGKSLVFLLFRVTNPGT